MGKSETLTKKQKYELCKQVAELGKKILAANGGRDIVFVREK